MDKLDQIYLVKEDLNELKKLIKNKNLTYLRKDLKEQKSILKILIKEYKNLN